MAEGNGDQVNSCCACHEEYDENEDHTPRILPCFHSICQSCLQLLLDDKSLACPTCQTVHPATEGVKSFQQNIYIISYIKRKNAFAKCKLHDGKELSLYCKTADCQRSICQLCLLKEHKEHEVVDIVEEQKEKKETIKNIANKLTSGLTVARENLLEARKSMEKYNTATLTMLKERKTKIVNLMDKKIKDATDQIATSNKDVDKEVDNIDRNLKLVNSTKERSAKSRISDSFSTLDSELERIKQVMDHVQKYLLQEKIFQYYDNEEVSAKPMKMVVTLSDTRNSGSSHVRDEIGLGGAKSTSVITRNKNNEVTSTGTGSTSSRSNNKRDEVRPTGTTSTSSSSNNKREEDRPTGTGSTSSRSNNKRDEVRPTGIGNTTSSSKDKRNEVTSTATGSISSSSSNKRDEVRPTGTGNTSSNSTERRSEVTPMGSTSSSWKDKRGAGSTNKKDNEIKLTLTGSTSSKNNNVRLTETGSSVLCVISDVTGNSSYFAKSNEHISTGVKSNEFISAGTQSSGLGSSGTHQGCAFGFQGLELMVSNNDDTQDDCVVVPRTSDSGDDEPPAKKIRAEEGGIEKIVKSYEIGRNVISCRVLPDDSLLVSSRRKLGYSWVYDLIKFGPGNEAKNCATLEQRCHGMTEMLLAGRQCLALTCDEKIEFRDLSNLEEVVSNYSVSQQDFKTVCFSDPLNVLFYENRNRSKSRSTILQLDCSRSSLILKSSAKQIGTFTVVNDMCYVQQGDEHLLVTAQRGENFAVCIYNTQTAELKWSQNTSIPNQIPSVTVDGVGNILICDTSLERIYKISATGEELGLILRNREKLFRLSKMQWCNRSSNLTLVYKNFKDKWCVTVFRMGVQT